MNSPSNHSRRVLVDQTITRSLWIQVDLEGDLDGDSPSDDDFKERAEELAKSIDFAGAGDADIAESFDAVAVEMVQSSSLMRPRA
jgi:hypothetical protein